MSLIDGTVATARFELRRSLTPGRMVAFGVLACFPPCIGLVLAITPGGPPPQLPLAATTLVICLLSNMLWATPVVYNELEGKTWIYSGARPKGRISLLLGKYINAVGWTIAVCWFAVTASIVVASLSAPGQDYLKIWLVLLGVSTLASIGYAATFTLIGTLFHRRSMMVAMAYCVVSEVAIAQIPAIIGKLTVSSHLYHILFYSLAPREMLKDPNLVDFVGEQAILSRSFAVLIIGAVALGVSIFIIRYREYLTTDET